MPYSLQGKRECIMLDMERHAGMSHSLYGLSVFTVFIFTFALLEVLTAKQWRARSAGGEKHRAF